VQGLSVVRYHQQIFTHTYLPPQPDKILSTPRPLEEWLWLHSACSALQNSFEGLFYVIESVHNFIKIDLGGKPGTISIDRLKLAHLDKNISVKVAKPKEQKMVSYQATPTRQQWFLVRVLWQHAQYYWTIWSGCHHHLAPRTFLKFLLCACASHSFKSWNGHLCHCYHSHNKCQSFLSLSQKKFVCKAQPAWWFLPAWSGRSWPDHSYCKYVDQGNSELNDQFLIYAYMW